MRSVETASLLFAATTLAIAALKSTRYRDLILNHGIPVCSMILNRCFDRSQENSRREFEKFLNERNQLLDQVIKSLQGKDILLAKNLCARVKKMHLSIYSKHETEESNHFLLEILTKEVILHFYLKEFDQANALIHEAFDFIKNKKITACDPAMKSLYNAKGLISFIKSYTHLTGKSDAISAFEASLKIDPSQNNVRLYLKLLEKKPDSEKFFTIVQSSVSFDTECLTYYLIPFVIREGLRLEKNQEASSRAHQAFKMDKVFVLDTRDIFQGLVSPLLALMVLGNHEDKETRFLISLFLSQWEEDLPEKNDKLFVMFKEAQNNPVSLHEKYYGVS